MIDKRNVKISYGSDRKLFELGKDCQFIKMAAYADAYDYKYIFDPKIEKRELTMLERFILNHALHNRDTFDRDNDTFITILKIGDISYPMSIIDTPKGIMVTYRALWTEDADNGAITVPFTHNMVILEKVTNIFKDWD